MSFHLSANNLSLNGNNNGRFEWGSTNFAASAQNISFSIEGGGAVPVLRASLQDTAGGYVDADLNLAERIENSNGQFVFNCSFLQWAEKLSFIKTGHSS